MRELPNSMTPVVRPLRRAGKACGIAVILAATAYLTCIGTLWREQDSYIFRGDSAALLDPNAAGFPAYTVRHLQTGDGHSLAFWAADPAGERPVILYFHGQGGPSTQAAEMMASYVADGYGVVLSSYRGYTGNPGVPSEAVFRSDAQDYHKWVSERWPNRPIILWGLSLGTGVAVGLAGDRPVAGVVLDSPYTSIADVAARLFPWAPVHFLCSSPFDTMALISKVIAPVMVVQGEEDVVIPVAQGRAVFDAIRNKGPGVFVPNAGHGAIFIGASMAVEAAKGFIAGIGKKSSPVRS